jgi:hypothetical protein
MTSMKKMVKKRVKWHDVPSEESNMTKEKLEPEVLYENFDNRNGKFRLVLNHNCQLRWEKSTKSDAMNIPIWLPTEKLELPEDLDMNAWEIIFNIAKVVVTKSQEEHIIAKLKNDVNFNHGNDMFDDNLPF